MHAVGHQRRRPDLAPDSDAVPGHRLVASKPGQRCNTDRDQIGHWPRMREPGGRLVGGQRGRRCDDHDDDDSRQVFCPPVPIRVAPVRRPPAHEERHSQRHCRQRIRGIVQGVAEERDRARKRHHNGLNGGGGAQNGERDPQRPDPLSAGFQRRIDLVGRLVGVRSHQLDKLLLRPLLGPAVVRMLVRMAMGAGVRVVVVDVTGIGVWMRHNAQDARPDRSGRADPLPRRSQKAPQDVVRF